MQTISFNLKRCTFVVFIEGYILDIHNNYVAELRCNNLYLCFIERAKKASNINIKNSVIMSCIHITVFRMT